MSKIAMIFGVTGQDGSYLSEFLLEKDYRVVGIKRRSSTNNLERLNDVVGDNNFSILEGDVVDPSSVNSLIGRYKPDEIYNLSAQSHVHTSFEQPLYTFQVNALGTIHILEAVRNYSLNSKTYTASTSEMWGSNYDIDENGIKYQDENTPFSPNSPYAVAKLAAHESVRLYRDAYNVWACAGIIHNHESCRRGEEFVTRKITLWIAKFYKLLSNIPLSIPTVSNDTIYTNYGSKPILKLGNIDAVRDWSHAKDMVRGMWMMLQQDRPKDYVLCSGRGHSVREFLDHAFACIDIDDWSKYVIIDPALYRPCEVEFLQGRYNLAKQELGWEPQISFQELVREMINSDIKRTHSV
jgi:GDPmannose 4,6-dehydratase